MNAPGLLLILVVAVVGVLHTMVPDHWVPIALLARQRGWSRAETARAAFQAGSGHVLTTLIIGLAVWGAGVAFATRFAHLADTVASLALIGFGGWIAIASWRDLQRGQGHGHSNSGLFAHSHRNHSHADHAHAESGTGDIHGPELHIVDTGHGLAKLSIYEEGMPPRFRFTGPPADWVRVETVRDDGNRQAFAFANRGDYWESLDEIPEPHGFEVRLTVGHKLHDHIYTIQFTEHTHGPLGHSDHGHSDHGHSHLPSRDDHGDDLYSPSGAADTLVSHVHAHRHGRIVHVHKHDHDADAMHDVLADPDSAPLHSHPHKTRSRMALLLILGSSPMVEGIPAFFAASRYGVLLIGLMAVVFAVSTTATYVILCVSSAAGLQRVKLGPLERYGEVFSGTFIALVGALFWVWPVV